MILSAAVTRPCCCLYSGLIRGERQQRREERARKERESEGTKFSFSRRSVVVERASAARALPFFVLFHFFYYAELFFLFAPAPAAPRGAPGERALREHVEQLLELFLLQLELWRRCFFPAAGSRIRHQQHQPTSVVDRRSAVVVVSFLSRALNKSLSFGSLPLEREYWSRRR